MMAAELLHRFWSVPLTCLFLQVVVAVATFPATEEDEVVLLQESSKVHGRALRPEASAYFWSGKNGDISRTGASEFAVPVNLSAGPAWSWHEAGNGVIRAAPLIDGEKNIYLASIRGGVYKFSPDGRQLWAYRGNVSIPGVPALMNGLLFTSTERAQVIALDMETGQPRWTQTVGSCAAGDTWSLTAAEGVVVSVASSLPRCDSNNEIVGLDARSGAILWRYTPQDVVYNFLSGVREGSLVFSDSSGRAHRLELSTGRVLWKLEAGHDEDQKKGFTTGGAIIGPDGIIYVTSNAQDLQGGAPRGYVTAYDFSTGSKLWRHCTEYQANNAAAAGHLTPGGPLAIVVGVGENPDLPDGVMQILNIPPTHPKPGRILALNATTGTELWRFNMPMWHGWAAGDTMTHICLPDSFGNPAISGDGTVFVGFENGNFYGLKDSNLDGHIDSNEVSAYDTHNAFQGSPGLAPGMVVATPCNGMHVFKTRGV